MRRAAPNAFGSMPGAGPVTKYLCIAIVAASLVLSVTQRTWGFGITELHYRVDAVLSLQLWRLVTYALVESHPFNLLLSVIVLWLFGRWFETSWGSRNFFYFFLFTTIGAGVLAIPLYFGINMLGLFRDIGMGEGPNAAIDAMLVALALNAPNSNVLFGFVLPTRAKTIVFLLIGFEVVSGVMSGSAGLSITLGGMAMGYFLITGNWRPGRVFNLLRRDRRRRGLYVVPPKKDPTLH